MSSGDTGNWLCRAAMGATAGAMTILLSGCQDLGLAGADPNATSVLTIMDSGPTPVEAVEWSQDQYDADKRFRGVLLIANAPWGGEPVYVELYEKALQDGDPTVRAVACRALGMHGEPYHAPMIARQLESDDSILRWEAARALQRLHDPAVVRMLIDAMDERLEDDADVRSAAATALGQYAEERVLDALVAGLDDSQLLVNKASLQSLNTLTGQDHGYDSVAWTAWIGESTDPFAGRSIYRYPAYYRKPTLLDHLAFWSPVPNEVSAVPVGMDAQPTTRSPDQSPDP